MRTALFLALAAILAAVPAYAQPNFFPTPIGPGGLIVNSNASVSVTNTTTETSIFQYVITPSLMATASSVGALGTPIYTGGTSTGLSSAPLYTTPAPLHFRAVGTLAGAAATTVNIGVNFGQITGGTVGVATLTINNNVVGAITTPTPYYLDVWLSPIASTSSTPTSANLLGIIGQADLFMVARAQYLNASGTLTTINSATVTSVNLASPTAINVVARWAAAASTSALTFYNRVFAVGQ